MHTTHPLASFLSTNRRTIHEEKDTEKRYIYIFSSVRDEIETSLLGRGNWRREYHDDGKVWWKKRVGGVSSRSRGAGITIILGVSLGGSRSSVSIKKSIRPSIRPPVVIGECRVLVRFRRAGYIGRRTKGLCRVDSDSDQTVMSDNDVGRLCGSPLFHLAESFPVWHTSSIQAITYYNHADRVLLLLLLLAMADISAKRDGGEWERDTRVGRGRDGETPRGGAITIGCTSGYTSLRLSPSLSISLFLCIPIKPL